MTYDLQIEIYPEYIYFQRTGTADKSGILESWTKAIEVCLGQGIKNLLVDTANEATLSAKEVFEMAVSLTRSGRFLTEPGSRTVQKSGPLKKRLVYDQPLFLFLA